MKRTVLAALTTLTALATTAALLPAAAPGNAAASGTAERATKPDLTHVVTDNFPDPGFLVTRAGEQKTYHLYATGGSFRSRTATSPRGPYSDTGPVLAARTSSSWERKSGHRWAPHVFKTGGRYVLWYTGTPKDGGVTTQGGTRYHDCIGAASSATPVPVPGQPSTRFQPTARPMICATRNQTLIDPAHFAQNGRHYLVYKRRTYSPSSYDIYAVEVRADGLARKAGAKPFRLVHATDGRIIEAPSLVKRGKTLWLFTSRRNYATCDYRTEVFTSSRLASGWRSVGVMNLRPAISSSRFCGPGGAEVVDDGGTFRIAFHAWDDPSTRTKRSVWTGPLVWGSGKPVVARR